MRKPWNSTRCAPASSGCACESRRRGEPLAKRATSCANRNGPYRRRTARCAIWRSRRTTASHELRKLGQQIGALESDIASRQDALGRWLALRYVHGEQSDLKLLLSGDDPNSVARELHYFSYISRAQAELIGALRTALARLRQLEEQAREASAAIAAAESAQRSEREALLRQQAERRKVLARVSGQLRDQRREVKHLERDEARLSRLVEELGKVIAARDSGLRNDRLPEPVATQVPFSALKGKLRLPIRGELVNRFGTHGQTAVRPGRACSSARRRAGGARGRAGPRGLRRLDARLRQSADHRPRRRATSPSTATTSRC